MACSIKFDQTAVDLCRSNSGIKTLYIANYSDYISHTLDSAGTGVSGLTMSGSTITMKSFYKLAQGQEISSFLDTASMPAIIS
jgi:hypothetical protein